ncbi:MAG: hypothetical protein IJ565_03420 [Bacilli bacterium]|nr:hypothetical protein [Bacilli bacterium]
MAKKIVLVHAKCPNVVLSDCNLTIKDDELEDELVWQRMDEGGSTKIGHNDYFTIIGHTPITTKTGYLYNEEQNFLNIDGGCSCYLNGQRSCDHIPLVEIDSSNNRLIILTFNNNNEIIEGNYFSDGISIPINNLDEYRKYLNPHVKLRKMKYKDGATIFE